MDKQTPRGRRQRPLRRPETGIGRPLPAPAGHDCQAGRSAVPPRGVQPVPVESVLEKARVGTAAFVRPSRAQFGSRSASFAPKRIILVIHLSGTTALGCYLR